MDDDFTDLLGDVDDLLFDFPGPSFDSGEAPFGPNDFAAEVAGPAQLATAAAIADLQRPAPLQDGAPPPASSAPAGAAPDHRAKRKAEQNRYGSCEPTKH